MTEKLRALLHDRATHADFATPDLDTLVRAGDRRRRRRSGALVGGVAALATVAAVAAARPARPRRHEPTAGTGPVLRRAGSGVRTSSTGTNAKPMSSTW